MKTASLNSAEWSFARTEGGEGADAQGAEISIHPSETNIYLSKGFKPGWIYELIYTGRDPLVLGLGDESVRDLVSFLRYGEKDAAGNPNPIGANTEDLCLGPVTDWTFDPRLYLSWFQCRR